MNKLTLLRRIKPYKAATPALTINKIESLFGELGFHYALDHITNDNLLYSCQLTLKNTNNGKVVFATNGKGNSRKWAEASAWGEMIERVQNQAFYTICLYASKPETIHNQSESFKYFPDEKLLSVETLNHHLKNLVPVHKQSVLCIPFVNQFNGTTLHIPFRTLQVIVGSNGMCSGNTREEALIQGISEVFERHILKEMYLHPFCPPDIAPELFSEFEIFHTIQKLITTYGFKISIKDCSMGKNYPVIGVLIENKFNEYAFHLGADPSPVTALERCFTEMFQGGPICFKNKDELLHHSPCNLDNDFWKQNFSYTISSYSGHWPIEIFNKTPDYVFNGFTHPVSVSDRNDLDFLFEIISNNNMELFIRDNSFLGQPAYQIYIPEFSEITSIPNDLFANIFLEFDNYITCLTNLYNCLFNQRAEMIKAINRFKALSPVKEFRAGDYFGFFREHPVARMSSDELISLLSIEEEHEYSKQLTQRNIPECFQCNECNLSEDCNFIFLSRIWGKLKQKMEAYYD